MRSLAALLLPALLPLACATPPGSGGLEPWTPCAATDCPDVFPRGSWQLTHAVQFFPPDGSSQTLIGVLGLSSEERRFHCVMMSIEGLVLFEAEYDGAITVRRAVAPLDRPGMAEGIVRDLRLMFFAPEGPCASSGPAPARVCRYPLPDEGREEILLAADGTWQIRLYGPDRRLRRTVASLSREDIRPDGFPARMELRAEGLAGYRLVMRLLEAAPVRREGGS